MKRFYNLRRNFVLFYTEKNLANAAVHTSPYRVTIIQLSLCIGLYLNGRYLEVWAYTQLSLCIGLYLNVSYLNYFETIELTLPLVRDLFAIKAELSGIASPRILKPLDQLISLK